MMQEAYKELEEALNSIENSFIDLEPDANEGILINLVKNKSIQSSYNVEDEGEDLNAIDVKYDPIENKQDEEIDI